MTTTKSPTYSIHSTSSFDECTHGQRLSGPHRSLESALRRAPKDINAVIVESIDGTETRAASVLGLRRAPRSPQEAFEVMARQAK